MVMDGSFGELSFGEYGAESGVVLSGNQPASAGVLSLSAFINLSGNQPAASGALFAGETILVEGNQPAASGALSSSHFVSLAFGFPVELLAGSAVSQAHGLPVELTAGAAVSDAHALPVELLESAGQAGDVEFITALPPNASVQRLRADLYGWRTSQTVKPQISVENIGSKLGIGSIRTLHNFQYSWALDSMGEWSAQMPANDPHAELIFDGTAKIIKIYFEQIGLIFQGWIEDYTFDGEDQLTLNGYDMAYFLKRRRSLYNHDFEASRSIDKPQTVRAYIPPYVLAMFPSLERFQTFTRIMQVQVVGFNWHEMMLGAADKVVPAPYTLEFLLDSPEVSEAYFVKRYQDQTVMEMWHDIGQSTGSHWRMLPNSQVIQAGGLGDDSGLQISQLVRDDPQARLQGLIPISNITVNRTKEFITNLLLGQGSNDAWGVAVELRYAFDGQAKFGFYPDLNWDDIAFPGVFPNQQDDSIPPVHGASYSEEEVLGLFWPVSGIDYGTGSYQSVADRCEFENGIRFAWAAWFGYRLQVYDIDAVEGLEMRIHEDSGGFPGNVIHTIPCTNFRFFKDISEVKVNGEPTRFSEPVFAVNNTNGYINLAPGTYHFSIKITVGNGQSVWVNAGCLANDYLIDAGAGFTMVNPDYRPQGASYKASKPGSQVSVQDWDGNWSRPDLIQGWTLVMEISGEGDGPYMIECQRAESVDLPMRQDGTSDSTTGQRIFFIRNNDSIEDWGISEGVVSFPNALDLRPGIPDVVPSSNALYWIACLYVDRRSDQFEIVEIESDGAGRIPVVGQKVWVQFRGFAKTPNGNYVWVDLNDSYWVLEETWNFSDDELRYTFKCAKVPEDFLSPNIPFIEMQRHVNRANNFLSEQAAGTHVILDPGLSRSTLP